MAWERRNKNGRRYYYLSVRRGNRVEKEYFGNGSIARLAFHSQQLANHQRREQRQVREQLDRQDDLLRELDFAAEVMLKATLRAKGFIQQGNKRWRRPRRAVHPSSTK